MTVVGTRISSSTRAMVSPVSSGRPSVTITSNCLPCAAERGGASSVLAPVASRAAPAPPARRRGRAPAWQPVRALTRQTRAHRCRCLAKDGDGHSRVAVHQHRRPLADETFARLRDRRPRPLRRLCAVARAHAAWLSRRAALLGRARRAHVPPPRHCMRSARFASPPRHCMRSANFALLCKQLLRWSRRLALASLPATRVCRRAGAGS